MLLLLLFLVLFFKNIRAFDNCRYYYDLYNSGLLDGKSLFATASPYCIEIYRAALSGNEQAICSKDPDVCFEYLNRKERRLDRSTFERRMLKQVTKPTNETVFNDETLNSIYYKYPEDYIFHFGEVENFRLLTKNDLTFIKNKTKASVLSRYRSTEHWVGFIFNRLTNDLDYVLETIDGKSYNLPMFYKRTNIYEFYERRFERKHRVYIDKHFGFKKKDMVPKQLLDKYILYPVNSLHQKDSDKLEQFCNQIPRCIGYIPTIGLVSTRVVTDNTTEFEKVDSVDYFEKETTHGIVRKFQDSIGLYIGIGVAASVFIYGMVIYENFQTLKNSKQSKRINEDFY